MLLKIALIFLAVMLGLSMLFKIRPSLGAPRKKPKLTKPVICGHCGQFILGKGGCDCQSRKG